MGKFKRKGLINEWACKGGKINDLPSERKGLARSCCLLRSLEVSKRKGRLFWRRDGRLL